MSNDNLAISEMNVNLSINENTNIIQYVFKVNVLPSSKIITNLNYINKLNNLEDNYVL